MFTKSRLMQTFALLTLLALAPAALAQETTTGQSSPNARTVASGQKMKIKGVVTRRDADTFTVEDVSGVSTVVTLTDRTSVKTKGGFFGGGKNFGTTSILRGLTLEVEGRGDGNTLVAEKVRFNESDMRAARAIDETVVPVEGRVGEAETRIGQAEQNAQRVSGQLEELAAVANAAGGGAVAAQETADRAVAGVRVANDRITSLDEFTPQQSLSVNFRRRSAVLSPDAKRQIDEAVAQTANMKGYLFEISGFAYDYRAPASNRKLSQQRAESVVRYLVEQHRVPLRRIVTPFGYGATQPAADNTTPEGREQNRRAEIRVLVNRGLAQPPTHMNPDKTSTVTPE